jgi:hypothetical protein
MQYVLRIRIPFLQTETWGREKKKKKKQFTLPLGFLLDEDSQQE